MKQYQIIRENDNHEIEVVETSTRKRDIETAFNRWVRILKKAEHNFVERRNMGWAIVTTYGTFSTWTTEYYIRLVNA